MNISNTLAKSSSFVPAQRIQSQLRFQGAIPAPKAIISAGKATKDNAFAKFLLWLEKFKSTGKDEIVNIVITSVGTGIVAPLFIAFNKFNKEDKHVKYYSAWRQPLSAALAILTQWGINAPVARTFERLARRGAFGDKYLGSERNLHENDPAFDTAERKLKNTYILARYEEALKKPEFREEVANFITKKAKEEYEEQVLVAQKGRASYPAPAKIMTASEVTLKHAKKYTAHNLKQLKYVGGLMLSLITLYPTAMLLNYVYPRFMDMFLPGLTKEDKVSPQQTVKH